jgi:hypothetical protein
LLIIEAHARVCPIVAHAHPSAGGLHDEEPDGVPRVLPARSDGADVPQDQARALTISAKSTPVVATRREERGVRESALADI